MITAWTKHLKDPKDIEQFNNQVTGSRPVLERLSQLIDELEAGIERQELDPKAYDSPNWSARQAHANGLRAGLRKIQTLIKPDQAERTNK